MRSDLSHKGRGEVSRRQNRFIDHPRPGLAQSKGGLEARRFDEVAAPFAGCPGGAGLHPGQKSLLGLLGFLCLLRLFRLLRFLSHSILIWVNGWKRDTRHARRRASLAISSKPIPTDSQAPAPHCHAGVIALSTVVMRFRAFCSESLPRTRCGVDTGSREENASNKEAEPPFRFNRNGGSGLRGPCFGIVNPDAAMRAKALSPAGRGPRDSSNQNHSTDCAFGGEKPLSPAVASCVNNGDRHGWAVR
jgi:hypothetical protein